MRRNLLLFWGKGHIITIQRTQVAVAVHWCTVLLSLERNHPVAVEYGTRECLPCCQARVAAVYASAAVVAALCGYALYPI